MTTYIIKRVLLMIPTFFAISLITFLVLNLAPGRPGGSEINLDGSESSVSVEARESYQIFKEQFNFDKPVLFNTRFALDRDDILVHLLTLADFRRPPCSEKNRKDCVTVHVSSKPAAKSPVKPSAPAGPARMVLPVPDEPARGRKPVLRDELAAVVGSRPQPPERLQDCLPAIRRPSSAAVVESQETLEDWGEYSVPALLEVARSYPRLEVRVQALHYLRRNAKQRLVGVYGKKLTEEEKAYNRAAGQENEHISRWRVSDDASEAEIAAILAEKWIPWFDTNRSRFRYGLVDKISVALFDTRFAKYFWNLIRLDFGVSHVDKQPVFRTIAGKLKVSLILGFFSLVLAYLVSVPLGVWSAYRQNSKLERVTTVVLFMLYSLPSFFVGVLLLELFTVGEPFDWFPTGGFVGADHEQMTTLQYLGSVVWHMALPVLCLTYGSLASLSRYARAGLLEVIRADYIRTARAKGLPESVVILKHAVRNGMIPILTLLGSLLPALVGGSVVVEYIFSIPGMGLYLFESITLRDYNAIMAVLLMSTVLTLLGFLLSDICYAIVDPRISFE